MIGTVPRLQLRAWWPAPNPTPTAGTVDRAALLAALHRQLEGCAEAHRTAPTGTGQGSAAYYHGMAEGIAGFIVAVEGGAYPTQEGPA